MFLTDWKTLSTLLHTGWSQSVTGVWITIRLKLLSQAEINKHGWKHHRKTYTLSIPSHNMVCSAVLSQLEATTMVADSTHWLKLAASCTPLFLFLLPCHLWYLVASVSCTYLTIHPDWVPSVPPLVLPWTLLVPWQLKYQQPTVTTQRGQLCLLFSQGLWLFQQHLLHQ